MVASFRQPGLYFHNVAAEPVFSLPRMDVAGFVGFASSGPLHTPVRIESMKEYRNVFGEDLALAWDPLLKQMQYSLLGNSVESFFRNGGLRCWVVRVADDGEQGDGQQVARLAYFDIPGLFNAEGGEAAVIQARSPGNWAQQLRLGSRLNIQTLATHTSVSSGSPDTGLLSIVDDTYSLRLASLNAELQVGDLVELRCGQQGVRAYLFVQTWITDDLGIVLNSSEVYWFLPDADPQNIPEPVNAAVGMQLYEDFIATSPQQTPVIRWLRFDLLVWRGRSLQSQLNGLAFHPAHPRYWGQLPTDQQLYGHVLYGDSVGRESAYNRLLDDITYPRFALAVEENPEQVFIPLTMGISSQSSSAVEADFDNDSPPTHIASRDGLATFSADLFLDKSLAELGLASLMSEANHQRFVERRRLRGIYSLVGLDEISMIAVPDILHRHWHSSAPDFEPALMAPILKPITEVDAYGRRQVEWSSVESVRRYILQQSLSVDFEDVTEYRIERSSPLELDGDHQWPEAPETFISLILSKECTRHYYFRVRAEGHGQLSPWSNTRAIRIPPDDFYDCQRPDPSLLDLTLSVEELTADYMILTWQPPEEEGQTLQLADICQLQLASDKDFISAQITEYPVIDHSIDIMQTELATQADSVAYFRVRALAGDIKGPWSNTIAIHPERLSLLTLKAVEEYDDQDLKAVQFALTRLCAARADMLAVLCLPAHYQDDEISKAMDDLLPRSMTDALTGGFGTGICSVMPLNTGEAGALSYTAMYSPWLRVSFRGNLGEAGNVYSVPAAGAVCGKLAITANSRGAWIASENKPLSDVLGLGYYSTGDTQQAQLWNKQVNIITPSPNGFVVSRGSTLSRSDELQALNVRRLLLLLKRLALREGNLYVFEPDGVDFRNRVQHYWENLLNDLYRRGAFRGNSSEAAYRVVTDESVNDQRSRELGRFVVELQVSPSQPMSFIHIRLIQSDANQLVFQEL